MTKQKIDELLKLAKEECFLVYSCGDGSYDSNLVFGLNNARRMIAEHMWFGTYEEACEDEMVAAFLAEFDDHENWEMGDGGWLGDGEQFHIGVKRVQNLETITALCEQVLKYRESLEALSNKKCFNG